MFLLIIDYNFETIIIKEVITWQEIITAPHHLII